MTIPFLPLEWESIQNYYVQRDGFRHTDVQISLHTISWKLAYLVSRCIQKVPQHRSMWLYPCPDYNSVYQGSHCSGLLLLCVNLFGRLYIVIELLGLNLYIFHITNCSFAYVLLKISFALLNLKLGLTEIFKSIGTKLLDNIEMIFKVSICLGDPLNKYILNSDIIWIFV